MSRDIIDRNVVFTCDKCSDVLATDEQDWKDALEVMKGEGWLYTLTTRGRVYNARQGSDEWFHYCPKCRELEEDDDE